MGFSSLHVCMESSSDHWLQGTIHEDSAAGMDSSSSPSPISSAGDMNMIACSSTRPMTERKLRPPQDQLALKCPRCDSAHTKFCYYNNYSLSQPRYFCKSCRRYWTKGGTLRNIPVGGSCRKNKKVSSKKSNNDNNNNQSLPINQSQTHHPLAVPSYLNHPKELLQLSNNFPPELQFPHHINNLLIGSTNAGALMENPNFMESKYNMGMLESMIRSTSRNLDFYGMNGGDVGVGVGNEDHVNGYINNNNNVLQTPNNYQGFSSSSAFGGMPLIDGNNILESCNQRLMMLPYGSSSCDDEQNTSLIDVKPNPRVLSIEWQDMMQGRSDGPGSWNGVINGYGCSTTNPLV